MAPMESLSGRSPEVADGFVAVGRIGAPWGVRGHVKMVLHTDFPERLLELQQVYLGPQAEAAQLLESRAHGKHWILLLEGIADRTEAQSLRGLWVQVPLADIAPLAEGEHYVFELIGLSVYTTDGRQLGEIAEILFTGANEVFVVRGAAGEVLVPYINDVVVSEDLAAGRILIEPVPGLLNDDIGTVPDPSRPAGVA